MNRRTKRKLTPHEIAELVEGIPQRTAGLMTGAVHAGHGVDVRFWLRRPGDARQHVRVKYRDGSRSGLPPLVTVARVDGGSKLEDVCEPIGGNDLIGRLRAAIDWLYTTAPEGRQEAAGAIGAVAPAITPRVFRRLAREAAGRGWTHAYSADGWTVLEWLDCAPGGASVRAALDPLGQLQVERVVRTRDATVVRCAPAAFGRELVAALAWLDDASGGREGA